MPIEHHEGGTTITGDSIDYFALCTQKLAVGAELRGMKLTRGPAVWPRVKKAYGIKGNKQAVYDWLVAKVGELKAQQEHRTVEGGREIREVGGREVQ